MNWLCGGGPQLSVVVRGLTLYIAIVTSYVKNSEIWYEVLFSFVWISVGITGGQFQKVKNLSINDQEIFFYYLGLSMTQFPGIS